MTGNLPTVLSATLLAALGVLPARAAEMGTQISYQGSLTNGGSPVNAQIDMRFTLYDAAVGGNVVGMSAVFDGQPGNGAPVDVVDGLLSATPDFGANVFDGTAIWLQVDVRNPHDPTDSAPYELLDPRQPITAAPVALQTKGIFVDENTGNVGVGTTSPNDELDVAGNVHANGTITSGNSIVVDGTSGAERIISSDALEIHTGSGRALRLEPEATTPGGRFGPNVVGGWQGNAVTAGVTAATIAGGGATSFNPMFPLTNANRVTDDFGTVSGGIDNTAGDDDADPSSAFFPTIAGGAFNIASGFGATVGGGTVNTASGSSNATVGGGTFNTASGRDATVSGGAVNEASGQGATVPGGAQNVAAGSYSFAAGFKASVRTDDDGTFVWADSTQIPAGDAFESTGPDQFLIRASGGVGIGTNAPSEQLDVDGNIKSSGTILSGDSIIIDGTAGAETISSTAALELHTGGGRILRLEPEVEYDGVVSPNLIAGWSGNTVAPGIFGATISGGGADVLDDQPQPNRVLNHFGTIGGGVDNQTGNGLRGFDDGVFATVGGGAGNMAIGYAATISGGQLNTATQLGATVAGGQRNVATLFNAAVGGGSDNIASGTDSTVPGGDHNVAGGSSSFAAGRRAVVRDATASGDYDGDEGTFVWADRTSNQDFISTGPNQFLIRASGGVGIGTNAPGEQLTVAGRIESTSGGFKFPDGTIQTTSATDATGDIELFSDSGNSFPEVRISPGTSGDTFGGSLELSGDGGIPLRVRISNSTNGGSLELFGQFSTPLFHARAQAGGGALVTGYSSVGTPTFEFDGNSGAVFAGDLNGAAISGTSVSARSGASQVAKLLTSTAGGALETTAMNGVTRTARFGSSDSAPGGQMWIHQANGTLTASLDGDQFSFGQPNMGAVFTVRQSNGVSTVEIDGDQVIPGNPPTKNQGGAIKLYGGDGGQSVVLDGDIGNGNGGGSLVLHSFQGSPHVELRGGDEQSATTSETGGLIRVLRDNGQPGVEIFGQIEGSLYSPTSTLGSVIRMFDETGAETVTLDSDGMLGLVTGSFLEVDNIVAEFGDFSENLYANFFDCGTIDASRVGIGRSVANNQLEVEGEASKSIPGLWIANSDRRIKTNVETVTNALDTLDQVRLVSYEYTDAYRAHHPDIVDRRHLNIIAQEFAEVFPDYVKGSGEFLPDGSEILQADPYPLVIYAAAAVQELHQQLKDRESQLAELRAEVEQFRSLREELAALRAEMTVQAVLHKADTAVASSSQTSVALSDR